MMDEHNATDWADEPHFRPPHRTGTHLSLLDTPAKRLILCFDGTGNKFSADETDTNIVKIFELLDRTTSDQYHYYQRK